MRRHSFSQTFKKGLAVLLAVAMLLAFAPSIDIQTTEAATLDPVSETLGNLEPPAHHKTATDNGDGTYDLTLDVHGIQTYDTNVVLVLDLSTSIEQNTMIGSDGTTRVTSLTVLKETALDFIDSVYESAANIGVEGARINFSIVRYKGNAEVVQTWTSDQALIRRQINNLSLSGLEGNTNTQAGLFLARQLLISDELAGIATNRPASIDTARSFVVFMTDGAPNRASIVSGTEVRTKLDESRSAATTTNVDSITGEIAEPRITATSAGKIITTTGVNASGQDTVLSSEVGKTDYRKIAVEATLMEAEKLYELDQAASGGSVTTLTVGLNEWFTEDITQSAYPTAPNFLRLISGVANGLITYAEADAQLGNDIGTGAMPGTNPYYPIGTNYTNFQTGSTYAVDGLTNRTLAQLQALILQYYGTAAEQQQDGIYRLEPFERQNTDRTTTTIDITEITKEYTYFGNTAAVFHDSFDNIASIITMGYSNVTIVDMLSQYVSALQLLTDDTLARMVLVTDEIAQASGANSAAELLATFYDAPVGSAQEGWYLFILRDPSFVNVAFYQDLNGLSHNTNPNPPSYDKWTTTYVVVTNRVTTLEYNGVTYTVPDKSGAGMFSDEFITLEFDESYMLAHNRSVSITIPVIPTLYAYDTLYNNRNNLSAYTEEYSANVTIDGTQTPVTFETTNGYPDQAFSLNFAHNVLGMTEYEAIYHGKVQYAVDSTDYTGTAQYGFFTNTYAHSRVRYVINNVGDSVIDTSLSAHYEMPVIQPELIDLPVTKYWGENATTQPVYIKIEWEQPTYEYTVVNGLKDINETKLSTTITQSEVIELNAGNNWTNTFTDIPQGHTYTVSEWADAACTEQLSGYQTTFALADDARLAAISLDGDTLTIANPCLNSYIGGGLHVFNSPLIEKTATKTWYNVTTENGEEKRTQVYDNIPDAVLVQLFANGHAVGEPVYITAETIATINNVVTSWAYTWTDLPQCEIGLVAIEGGYEPGLVNINYHIAELGYYDWDEATGTYVENTALAYSAIITVDENGIFRITNTTPVENVSITVKKSWVDDTNRDGKRPASLKVQLLRDDTPIYLNGSGVVDPASIVELNRENGWFYRWEVPYGSSNSVDDRYTYTVVELDANGNQVANGAHLVSQTVGETSDLYTTTGDTYDYTVGYVTSGTHTTITNTHESQLTTVTITKEWIDANNQDGLRPPRVIGMLYADNVPLTDGYFVLTSDNAWTTTISNLPAYKDARAIQYTIAEISTIADYTSSTPVVTGSPDAGYSITFNNTHVPLTLSYTVEKKWADTTTIAHDPIDVTLYRHVTADGSTYTTSVVETVSLSSENNWTYNWPALQLRANGYDIVYTISEVTNVTGYVATTTTTTIVNSPIKSVTVQKVWDDDDNAAGKRPAAVTVRLLQNGEIYGSAVQLNAGNNWEHTFTNLPVNYVAADGTTVLPYVYTAVERTLETGGYYLSAASAEDNFVITITNTLSREDIELVIEKEWDVKDNFNYYAEFNVYQTVSTTPETGDGERTLLQLVRLNGVIDNWETEAYKATLSLPAWQTLEDGITYYYEYDVEEVTVGVLSGTERYYSSFESGLTSDARFASIMEQINNTFSFTNRELVSIIGAQAHIVHSSDARNEPLYTDGIRFGADLSMEAMDAMLDVGDTFGYGLLTVPYSWVDLWRSYYVDGYASQIASADNVNDYLMSISSVTNGTTTHYASLVYANTAGGNLITWTEEMEAAAKLSSCETLAGLLAAQGYPIYQWDDTTLSLRYIVYIMYSQGGIDDKLRITQANTDIMYRAFLIKRDSETNVETIQYSTQRYNSAQRIFDWSLWNYESTKPTEGERPADSGYSLYYPALDIQAVRGMTKVSGEGA
ncbi:MAG: Cna B-type domain-containing protein [Clostridia bacterium]|nr:Cna B-type domain-containing protein [Clostridia bacterium]